MNKRAYTNDKTKVQATQTMDLQIFTKKKEQKQKRKTKKLGSFSTRYNNYLHPTEYLLPSNGSPRFNGFGFVLGLVPTETPKSRANKRVRKRRIQIQKKNNINPHKKKKNVEIEGAPKNPIYCLFSLLISISLKMAAKQCRIFVDLDLIEK